jgi:putative ABC transport system permease protein
MHGLLLDLRLALRGLRRDSVFTVTAVATMAIALALNVTVFTVMDAMLYRGLPLAKHSDRLLYLAMRKPSDLACCPSPVRYEDFQAWRSGAHAFEDMAFGRRNESVSFRDGSRRPIDMRLTRRTANTFGLLGVQTIIGRDFVAADEGPGAPPVAIISYRFWDKRFSKRPDVVGLPVDINGMPATIIGVLPERFELVYEQDLFMPLTQTPAMEGEVIGRLRDGATQDDARTELETITRRLQLADPVTPRGVPSVLTYSQAHVAADAPIIYRTLWTGAWFVLLIACANIANLALVRTIGRWREFSTRIALGASAMRMARQIIAEYFALSTVAAAIAWRITTWSVRTWAEATASQYLALDYSITSGTLIYLVSIASASALLIALLPISRVMQLRVSGALKGGARGVSPAPRGKQLTTSLVAVQMALAIVLLLGAGVLVRSFEKIVGASTGVRDPERILVGSVRLPSDKYSTSTARTEFFDRLAVQLKTVSSSEAVSIASTVPTRGMNLRRFEIDGRRSTAADGDAAGVMTAGPQYFRVMTGSAIDGRDFTDADDALAALVVLINQSFAAEFWPGERPVGKRLRFIDRGVAGPWRTIIGIAPNIMQNDATRQRFKPLVYVPYKQQPSARAFMFVRSSVLPNELAQIVLSEVQRLDADVLTEDFSSLKAKLAFDRDFMDLEHADLAKHAAIAPVFGVIALLVAAIGLVAVIAHSVTQRTKEIGVRMAIGAATRDIARMIVREGMRPVTVGLLVGLGASAGANRLLQSQLVGISPYDPVTMAAGPLVLIVVALIGCQIPARRAMRVEPAVALRHE